MFVTGEPNSSAVSSLPCSLPFVEVSLETLSQRPKYLFTSETQVHQVSEDIRNFQHELLRPNFFPYKV